MVATEIKDPPRDVEDSSALCIVSQFTADSSVQCLEEKGLRGGEKKDYGRWHNHVTECHEDTVKGRW